MAVTLTISDASRASGDETHEARLALLEEHRETVRARLAETARNLDLIDHKIDFYRERLAAR